MEKNLVRKGQYWLNNRNQLVKIIKKATGNYHWHTKVEGNKKTHHLHEGTLQKFYKLIK